MRTIAMATIAVALVGCAVAPTATAEAFQMPNKAGGHIVITDRPCNKSDVLRSGYSYNANGRTLDLCWGFYDNRVQVIYLESGNRYSYPVEEFERVPDPGQR